MFKLQIAKFAEVLIEKRIVKNEDKEIIVHGFASGIELVFNIITTIILGFISGLVIESLVFLISFSFIRIYAGGYHCQKAINCYFFSSGIVVLVLSIIKFTPKGYILTISMLILFVSVPIILKLAPMETETKPLDEVEKQHYRKITIRNLIIECFIISILLVAGTDNFAFVMSLGIVVTAGVVVLQNQIKNKILEEKKMFKMKKLLSRVLSCVMIASMSTSVFAANENSVIDTQNYNVSIVEPVDNFGRGTSIPSKEWNVNTNGAYSFEGTSDSKYLYTSYLITGKDRYTVTVTNDSDYKLTVKVKTRFKTYSIVTIASNDTVEFDTEGMSDSAKIYILFEGLHEDFSGSIG